MNLLEQMRLKNKVQSLENEVNRLNGLLQESENLVKLLRNSGNSVDSNYRDDDWSGAQGNNDFPQPNTYVEPWESMGH